MKFRLVDQILTYEPAMSIDGLKAVSFEEYQLKTAFDRSPCLPESLLMETLFQLGNWLIILTSNYTQMGLLVRFQEIRFHQCPGPGHTLTLNVRVRRYRADGALFDGHISVQDQMIAQGTGCLATLVPLEDYYDPADLKVLFSEIYRPKSN